MANIIAVIWDCDKTLIDGYMQDPIFKRFEIDSSAFWKEVNSAPDKLRKGGIRVIAELYRNGVDVTVNSDDVLIFDSDVSKEYLHLYQSGCLSEEELDHIRENGLRAV